MLAAHQARDGGIIDSIGECPLQCFPESGMAKPRKSRSKAGRRKSRDQVSDDLLGMMQAMAVDDAADYVSRGRAHRDLTDANLVCAWAAVFRAYSHNPEPAGPLRSALKDLGAELDLRRIEPPFDDVREDMERLKAATDQLFAQLRADPERLAEVERDVQLDLISFRARRDRPKNRAGEPSTRHGPMNSTITSICNGCPRNSCSVIRPRR